MFKFLGSIKTSSSAVPSIIINNTDLQKLENKGKTLKCAAFMTTYMDFMIEHGDDINEKLNLAKSTGERIHFSKIQYPYNREFSRFFCKELSENLTKQGWSGEIRLFDGWGEVNVKLLPKCRLDDRVVAVLTSRGIDEAEIKEHPCIFHK